MSADRQGPRRAATPAAGLLPRLLLLLACAGAVACGPKGTSPASELDGLEPCPSLAAYLPETLALLESDGVPALREALDRNLDTGTRRTLLRLVFAMLDVIPPSQFELLEPLVGSPQLDAMLRIVDDLLSGMAGLPAGPREEMVGGARRLSQTCSLRPALVLLERLLASPDEVRAALPDLLTGFTELLDPEEISPETWVGLLEPTLEIAASAADKPERLRALIRTVARIPGFEGAMAATALVDDPLLMGALADTATCLLSVERSQDKAILRGLGELLSRNVLDMALLGDVLRPDPKTLQVLVPIRRFLSGIAADPDALDALRVALGWLLNPDQAIGILPDISKLIRSGAVHEILGLAIRIGEGDCALPPPGAQD